MLAKVRGQTPTRHTLMFVVGVSVVAGLILLPGLFWRSYDGAFFTVVGEQWARGIWPYSGTWDHKPPGIYVVTAMLSYLPGATWPWLWLATVAAIAGTGLAVRRLAGAKAALMAVVVAALAAGRGGQTETFATAFVALALLARPVGAGVWAAIGMAFSFQVLPVGLALLVLHGRKFWKVMVGGIAVVGAAAGLLFPAGYDAFDVLVTYNRVYLTTGSAADDRWPLMLLAAVPLLVPTLMLRPPLSRLQLAALAWLIFGIGLLFVQRRLLQHYVGPFAVPLAILAAPALQSRLGRFGGIAATAAAFSAVMLVTLATGPERQPAEAAVGRWIRDNTGPAERVLMWGLDGGTYLDGDREPAGRYVYLIPLVTPGYTTPQMVSSWVDSLRSSPPAVIIDSEAFMPYWADGDDFFRTPPPGKAGGRDLDIVDPFRDFVRDNYRFAAEIRGRKIYVLKR